MKLNLTISIANRVHSNTNKVWETLVGSYEGNLSKIKRLADDCPELLYAQYNYTPPIHLAVLQDQTEVVKFLLDRGALDPTYKTYPFQDSLLALAKDRNNQEIVALLDQYLHFPEKCRFRGDCGEIFYNRSTKESEFERAVDKENIDLVKNILNEHPEYAKDPTYFWSEGILTMPAKEVNYQLMEILMEMGATVPLVNKWCRYYYFEKYEAASFLLKKGMDPNHHSWHNTTILHDMAQEGNLEKAKLLIEHGAKLNVIEDEYRSTPLGFAVRWGHYDMVKLLLDHGADPNKSGSNWSSPLQWARRKKFPKFEKLLKEAGAINFD